MYAPSLQLLPGSERSWSFSPHRMFEDNIAQLAGADEAAERARELDPAARIGRRLRTFFIRPFDSMKSIARSRLEPEKSAAFAND